MKKLLYSTILFLATLSGCHYLDDYSQNLVVVKSFSDLDEVLLGDVYISSREEVGDLAYGDAGWWLLILDDDINSVVYEGTNASIEAYHYGKATELLRNRYYGYTAWQKDVGRPYDGGTSAADNDLWASCYNRINICNIVLDEIEKLAVKTDDDQLDAWRIRGEAHFLRAYFYFILNNVYGDMYEPDRASEILGVPLKLTPYVEHDKDKDSQFDRATLEHAYAQIIKDLKTSIEYFEQSPQTRGFYRASGPAAKLLLSRVYLYMQNWKEARDVAGELLETTRLLPRNYNNIDAGDFVISRDNSEILFSQGSLNVQNAVDGKIGDFCISHELYDLYDDEDARKSRYFHYVVSTEEYAIRGKYRQGYHQSYVSDLNMLRISEAYLNMAEACIMDGDNTEATKWLNDFRRYRINNYRNQTYDDQTLVEEIRNERRKEFCIECGHRWFDLRRYAVNTKYPYSKTIERIFAVYDSRTRLQHTEIFQLEEHDQAYTFAIPKSVLEFDTGMPDNEPRPLRDPIEIINPSTN